VTIQINRQAQKVVKFQDEREDLGEDQRFYQTQYDLLKSRSLAEKVASDLNLAAASDFLNPQSTSAWGKLVGLIFRSAKTTTENNGNSATTSENKENFGERKAVAAGMVQGGLSVASQRTSSLVKLSFASPSPEWAQRIANGVADSYISSNLDRRFSATAYARDFLKERLEELKLKLEDSEKALVAYADQKGLVDAGNKQSLSESDLVALNGALQKVVAERIYVQQLSEQANNSQGLGLPQV